VDSPTRLALDVGRLLVSIAARQSRHASGSTGRESTADCQIRRARFSHARVSATRVNAALSTRNALPAILATVANSHRPEGLRLAVRPSRTDDPGRARSRHPRGALPFVPRAGQSTNSTPGRRSRLTDRPATCAASSTLGCHHPSRQGAIDRGLRCSIWKRHRKRGQGPRRPPLRTGTAVLSHRGQLGSVEIRRPQLPDDRIPAKSVLGSHRLKGRKLVRRMAQAFLEES